MIEPPHIVIRADASETIGGGHLMRCLALAKALQDKGARFSLCTTPESLRFAPGARDAGFDLCAPDALPGLLDSDPPDIVIVDLPEPDHPLENHIMRCGSRLLVLDDVCDHRRPCHILVSPGLGRTAAALRSIVGPKTDILAGPQFALLRPEFAALRDASRARARRWPPRRVVVATGLTDVGGCMAPIARALVSACPDTRTELVVGSAAPSLPDLQALAARHDKLTLSVDIVDMAERLAACDLAIGAGGIGSLERCALGVPSLAVILAENQRASAEAMAEAGALLALRPGPSLEGQLNQALASLDRPALQRMGTAAAELCDGRGAMRVAEHIAVLLSKSRPPTGCEV
ncbi:UDP-2,4-diacetamido-2,4,6-trideoxy-beta-L-altropyranose hydrolase [Maricaulis sp. CAU 1757]